MHSDNRLIKKAVGGDLKAYKKLFGRYQEQILYLSYDLVGDYDRAKEVAKQVFFAAFENISDFKNTISFSSWLTRFVISKSIEVRKEYYTNLDATVETKLSHNKLKKQTSNPIKESQISNLGLQNEIRSALLTLSTDQSVAIILYYFHNKSIKEIAEIMQWSVDAVRIKILKAVKELKPLFFDLPGK